MIPRGASSAQADEYLSQADFPILIGIADLCAYLSGLSE
jgi:hypothetical protein